jgi:hypothetical protein
VVEFLIFVVGGAAAAAGDYWLLVVSLPSWWRLRRLRLLLGRQRHRLRLEMRNLFMILMMRLGWSGGLVTVALWWRTENLGRSVGRRAPCDRSGLLLGRMMRVHRMRLCWRGRMGRRVMLLHMRIVMWVRLILLRWNLLGITVVGVIRVVISLLLVVALIRRRGRMVGLLLMVIGLLVMIHLVRLLMLILEILFLRLELHEGVARLLGWLGWWMGWRISHAIAVGRII